MKKPTILITGVAGFIGSNLAERLLALGKWRILGVDNLSAGSLAQVPSGVEFHEIDILSDAMLPLIAQADYVFHLAAKNCIADCQQDPVATATINILGTVRVLDHCAKCGVRKVIYAESSALYEGTSHLPSQEPEIHPQSFYAISKAAGMYFAHAYQRFRNLRCIALRYFCVYGPKQDYRRTIPPVMSAFAISLLTGKSPIIYGTGQKRRDFVFVDDINDFHIMCLENDAMDGKTFNLGSGESISIQELFQMMSHIMDRNVKPLYKEDLPGEAFETRADISAAKSLGWSPKTSLLVGLQHIISWIEKNAIHKDETVIHHCRGSLEN